MSSSPLNNPSVGIFLPPEIAANGSWSSTLIGTCDEADIYAIQCIQGPFPRCGAGSPIYNVTEALTRAEYTATTTRTDGTSVITQSCSLTGGYAALCVATHVWHQSKTTSTAVVTTTMADSKAFSSFVSPLGVSSTARVQQACNAASTSQPRWMMLSALLWAEAVTACIVAVGNSVDGSNSRHCMALVKSTIHLLCLFSVLNLPLRRSRPAVEPRDEDAVSVLEAAVESVASLQSSQPATGSLPTSAIVPSETSAPLCVPFEDPDEGASAVCQCSGYAGSLPTLTGPSPCGYQSIPASSTQTSTIQSTGALGFPFTSTAANGALVAFQTTTSNQWGPVHTGSSMTIRYGKRMAVTLASETSVNVGTLTSSALYTAVSSALMAACTDSPANALSASPTASVTECAPVPTISNVVYTDGKGDWYNDGEIEISIPTIQYFDTQSLQGLIATIAASLGPNSITPNNTWSPAPPYCSGFTCSWDTVQGDVPATISNIPGFAQAIFLEDTADAPGWPAQDMTVELKFALHNGGTFICADGALVTDSLAALALVPGLDFLAFLAAPALGVSVSLNRRNGMSCSLCAE
ncbi:hypothetical protein M409DRAFT_54493 [Zasmidium cellare ATCC 36951]|uniref:Uncharacterized protein n=1 Tax=Zasmidium cellare ATCC 36951 TaxID=1080233 RepID=A0A6A6CHG8_ZASCE|nr:uncharacterized protein M409DRAFT_54493 [Zasmidium cellare ATCC 36951]KAF2166697.1 hypothetical protein M409DRAFT_54493 [Zasmidium cellare ATCC 36951]